MNILELETENEKLKMELAYYQDTITELKETITKLEVKISELCKSKNPKHSYKSKRIWDEQARCNVFICCDCGEIGRRTGQSAIYASYGGCEIWYECPNCGNNWTEVETGG